PIEHFLAGGGSFPIILLTAKRTDQLKETLELLLKVRWVTKEQVTALQDAAATPPTPRRGGSWAAPGAERGSHGWRGALPRTGAALICSRLQVRPWLGCLMSTRTPPPCWSRRTTLLSPDFLEYFEANAPLLDRDASTFVLSAWNDNGFWGKVRDRGALHRTEYFPGLGWLLTRRLWDELRPKWPKAHWDHFLRDPKQHKGREPFTRRCHKTFPQRQEGHLHGPGHAQQVLCGHRLQHRRDLPLAAPAALVRPGRAGGVRAAAGCAAPGGARPRRRAGRLGRAPGGPGRGRGPLVPGGQGHPAGAAAVQARGRVLRRVARGGAREPPAAPRVRLGGAPRAAGGRGRAVRGPAPAGRAAAGPAGPAAGVEGPGAAKPRARRGRRRGAGVPAGGGAGRGGGAGLRRGLRAGGPAVRRGARAGGHAAGRPPLRGVLRPGPARAGGGRRAGGELPQPVPGHEWPGAEHLRRAPPEHAPALPLR
ncbi:unnamed protein product, partial [Heterosigma akashiwo]